MRTELISAISGLSKATLGTFNVSSDLPWSADGSPLYVKNLKRVYVDKEQVEYVDFIPLLSGNGVNSKVTTLSVYFTTDAKTLPSNRDALVAAIHDVKDTFDGFYSRECDISTEYVADTIVTTLEFRFANLL